MKIHPAQQGSIDWLIARAGLPTASEFSNLITPTGKIRTGKMFSTYLHLKIAEKWCGGPMSAFTTFDMDQGRILEEQAIPGFEFDTGCKIERVGLITTDDGRIGCSPDGLIGEDGGIEVKCPAVHTHIGYLMKGCVPDEYVAQVQGALFVTGRRKWCFHSYCRHFPKLTVVVGRDEVFLKSLEYVLDYFLSELEKGYEKLCKLNGGPPKRTLIPTPMPQTPEPEPEQSDDVIP